MKKYCIKCNKEFEKNYYSSKASFAKQRFCSLNCFGDSNRGIARPHSEETKIKIGLANKNNKTGLENGKRTRFKKTKIKASDIVGGLVSYRKLHRLVQYQLGKPDKCEYCGNFGLEGRKIHWANKSKLYKKNISDWVRLCVKCHYNFDENRKVLPIKNNLLIK